VKRFSVGVVFSCSCVGVEVGGKGDNEEGDICRRGWKPPALTSNKSLVEVSPTSGSVSSSCSGRMAHCLRRCHGLRPAAVVVVGRLEISAEAEWALGAWPGRR